MIDETYTTQQVEEIARSAARYAIERCLHPPDLDNEIEGVVAISTGGIEMARQRVHVVLPNGARVWITGATNSELIANALQKYGGCTNQTQSASETFKEYTDSVFDVFLRPRWKDTTLETNKFLLEKHVLPYFGEKKLADITTVTIQEFFATKSHLSKSYTKQMLIIMHEIFENAMEDGKIQKDPTASKRITLPDKCTTREALQFPEFQDIIKHIPDLKPDDGLLLALLCFTGMRRGEALGLKWENVDDEVLHVKCEVTFKSNQPVFHEYTKSKSGIRDLHIPDGLKPYLKNRVGTFVIGSGEAPITQSKFDRSWQRISKTINLYGATPHVLRHTFLSSLAASGVDPKTVQVIAGHSDFNFTFNRYIHKSDENVADASQSFSNRLEKLTQNLTAQRNEKRRPDNDSQEISEADNITEN